MDYEKLILDLKSNYEKSELVNFNFKNNFWFSPILMDYFYELLGFPTKELVEEFISCVISDLKMMLLKETVIYINNFYLLKRNWNVDTEFRDRYYYSYEEFIENMGNFFNKVDMNESEIKKIWAALMEKEKNDHKKQGSLEEYSKLLYKRIPKISFPWFAYSLSRSYEDILLDTQKNKLYVVHSKKLSLINIGENLVPTENARVRVEDAQNSVNMF